MGVGGNKSNKSGKGSGAGQQGGSKDPQGSNSGEKNKYEFRSKGKEYKFNIREAVDFAYAFNSAFGVGKLQPRRTVEKLEQEALERFEVALRGSIFCMSDSKREDKDMFVPLRELEETGQVSDLNQEQIERISKVFPTHFLCAIGFFGNYSNRCAWVRLSEIESDKGVMFMAIPGLLKDGNHNKLSMVWRESLYNYYFSGGTSSMVNFMKDKDILPEDGRKYLVFSAAIHTEGFRKVVPEGTMASCIKDHRHDLDVIIKAMTNNRKNLNPISRDQLRFFFENLESESDADAS
jgi:hypothetical protein